MKFSESWLREIYNPSLKLANLSEQITNAGLEVARVESLNNKDSSIEIELTPNRGDCLSVVGIAKDVAALNNDCLKINNLSDLISKIPELSEQDTSCIATENLAPDLAAKYSVELIAKKACPKYTGRVITGVDNTKQTPDWIQSKLKIAGINTINPVVDILNYVMLFIGQPMHAFDLEKLEFPLKIDFAQDKAEFIALDDKQLKLEKTSLVIQDKQGVQALAGIIGAKNSAVSTTTTQVFLESALFTMGQLANQARHYQTHTDSSHRFERGVDPNISQLAQDLAAVLIKKYCASSAVKISEIICQQAPEFLQKKSEIKVNPININRILGIGIREDEIDSILSNLGCEKTSNLTYLPPTFRYDLNSEIDLIEELIRIKGFSHIPYKLPEPSITDFELTQANDYLINQKLVMLGFSEVINYSFIDPLIQEKFGYSNDFNLLNPIANDASVMRQSLLPGLINNLKFNLNRQKNSFKLFEIGTCFSKTDSNMKTLEAYRQASESNKIAGLLAGEFYPEHWDYKNRKVDFFDLKGDLEKLFAHFGLDLANITWQKSDLVFLHPGQSAKILYSNNNQTIQLGYIGRIHPEVGAKLALKLPVFCFELDHASLKSIALEQATQKEFTKPSVYPSVRRDLAFWVNSDLPVGKLTDIINSINFDLAKDNQSILRKINIFDVYQDQNNNQKSIALSLVFQADMRTLEDQEVDSFIDQVVKNLADKFNAKIRDH